MVQRQVAVADTSPTRRGRNAEIGRLLCHVEDYCAYLAILRSVTQEFQVVATIMRMVRFKVSYHLTRGVLLFSHWYVAGTGRRNRRWG